MALARLRGLGFAASGCALVYLGAQASALGVRADSASRATGIITSGGAIRFGVIADVQYADADDGTNFAKTVVRRYRGALVQLTRAVAHWNAQSEPLAFVANLGDVIDGLCAKLGQSERAMDDVMSRFEQVRTAPGGGVVHLKGNHELYNFPSKDDLARRANGLAGSPEYCSFTLPSHAAAVRVIVLDAYKIAMMSPGAEVRAQARAILGLHNPNDVEGEGNWAVGLAKDKRHFVPYNGALGREQLGWLGAELRQAAALGERVLVLCHTPLHPLACGGSTMPWDYEAVLQLLHAEGKGAVVAVLAGHDHNGGYHRDSATGIHHLTFQSPLNKGAAGDSYGIIELDCDRLSLTVSGPSLADLLPPSLMEAHGPGQGAPLRLALRPFPAARGHGGDDDGRSTP